MHCENCGSEIQPGARYCAGCGAPAPGGEKPSGKGLRERLSALVGSSRKERITFAGTVVAIIIALVGFVLLDTDDSAPERTAFTKAADQQCVIAKGQVARVGAALRGRSGAGAQVELAGGLTRVVTEWWLAFRELQPSAGLESEAAALDQALEGLAIDLGSLARVSRAGDAGGVARSAAEADAASGEVEAAVSDLGLTDCAAISLSGSTVPG